MKLKSTKSHVGFSQDTIIVSTESQAKGVTTIIQKYAKNSNNLASPIRDVNWGKNAPIFTKKCVTTQNGGNHAPNSVKGGAILFTQNGPTKAPTQTLNMDVHHIF